MLMSELTEKVVASHLIELVFMRSFYQRIVETALVREYNYVILDIVVVNTGREAALEDKLQPEFGNSNFGKEVFKKLKEISSRVLRKLLYIGCFF